MNKVRVRAITGGGAFSDLAPSHWGSFSRMYDEVERRFTEAGLCVQTRRLVLEPVRPQLDMELPRLLSTLDSATAFARQSGVRWICLPLSGESGWGAEDIRKRSRDIIRRYPAVFVHHILAERGEVYTASLPVAAQAVMDVSGLSNNGFDNFRMGAGANIAPNTPFFPFSWHEGRKGFSLAVEVLGLLLSEMESCNGAGREEIREHMTSALVAVCRQADEIARAAEAAMQGEYEYKGLDISLAPYPDDTRSVAKLVEHVSGRPFGEMGTLTGTAFFSGILKEAVSRAHARAAGFNGVMYSPLEDRHLANSVSRNADLLLEQFMLFSTVCGCGVDMVPVAGNILREELESLFLDVATLSCKLNNKPLGVRVLPIPMKRLNEHTDFNHDFLVNSRILRV